MRVDTWDKLELVIGLIKTDLPIDLKIALKDAGVLSPAPPLPYDPRIESTRVAVPLPILAEVRVSLYIDETLAWLLPVQFCIDQLLTAEEVVTKLSDAFWYLKAWSQVHSHEGSEHVRTRRPQLPIKSGESPLIQ